MPRERSPRFKKRDKSHEKVKDLMNSLELAHQRRKRFKQGVKAKSITKEEEAEEKVLLDQTENNLRQEKKRVLKGIIFPSMANLIVFLECIQSSPYLSERFEDDLRVLFLAKSNKRNRVEHMFSRLIKASCFTTVTEGKPIPNFRLFLVNIMQQIILQKMHVLGRSKFNDPFLWKETLLADMERAAAWTREIAYEARAKEHIEEARRKEKKWDSDETKQKKESERLKWTVSF